MLRRSVVLTFVGVVFCGGAISAPGDGDAPAAVTPLAPLVAYVIGGIQDQIAVVRADGSGRHLLPDRGGFDPSLSPDGTRVAYATDPVVSGFHDSEGLAVAKLDGSGIYGPNSSVGLSNVARPRWSPDGSRIAFENFSDDAAVGVEVEYVDLWVMQADGSQPRLLMQSPLDGPGDGSFGQQEGAAWCWSPDGGSIAIE